MDSNEFQWLKHVETGLCGPDRLMVSAGKHLVRRVRETQLSRTKVLLRRWRTLDFGTIRYESYEHVDSFLIDAKRFVTHIAEDTEDATSRHQVSPGCSTMTAQARKRPGRPGRPEVGLVRLRLLAVVDDHVGLRDELRPVPTSGATGQTVPKSIEISKVFQDFPIFPCRNHVENAIYMQCNPYV